ncbi:MAG TPA: class I SAM-dependent methyltransferase [Gaiellaceae bacterium]|jgi:hypothetical protein|nr:class I SAM-dependent methyltransferase [Gaiellaceae bacterium]
MALSTRLGYVGRAGTSMLRDPWAGLERVRGRIDRRRDRRAWRELGSSREDVYAPDPSWSRSLHALLGAGWPCDAMARFHAVWKETVGSLAAAGLSVGLATYGGWNDADPAMSEGIWCLVSHLRPRRVLETGVARGLTSRVILEGLERNGEGRLWSIDLPHLDTRLHDQIGTAVPEDLRARWTYVPGTSRSRLRPVLEEVGELDLFVHDSLHTGRNVRFELETVWPALRPGGAMVVDDIGHSLAFDAFTAAVAPCVRVTALHADGRGFWGLVLKGVPHDPPRREAGRDARGGRGRPRVSDPRPRPVS